MSLDELRTEAFVQLEASSLNLAAAVTNRETMIALTEGRDDEADVLRAASAILLDRYAQRHGDEAKAA